VEVEADMSVSPNEATVLIVDPLPLRNFGLARAPQG
jgi:hypothetical protein